MWIPTGQFKKDNGELSNEIILGRYTFDENNGTPHMVQNAEDYTNQSDNILIESIYKELIEYREGIASERLDGLNATAKGLGTFYANQDGQSINSTLTNTGTKQDEVCKINDLSSNIEEWSTEYSTTNNGTSAFPCTLRGGYYGSGSRSPSYRGAGNSYSGYFEGGGFRICLYL